MDITLERILSLIPKKPDGKYIHGAKAEFADSLGMARNLVSMWESGQSQSYRNKLHEIAAKYDVSVEWLKGETDEKRPAPKSESSKEKLLAAIDDMDRDELLNMLALVAEKLKEK
jgi:transcriptional regulator with XRE-family HTH domain